MQKANLLVFVFVAACVVGCSYSPKIAYVDIDQILKAEKVLAPSTVSLPSPPLPQKSLVETVPAVPGKTIKDPSNTPHLNVSQMFKIEQSKAFEELHRRLRKFYGSEIQKFRLDQEHAIAGGELTAYKEANDRIRTVFDKWASDRATTFAKLALVAGFPDPKPIAQPTSRALRPIEQARISTVNKLRSDLKTIDDRFYQDRSMILSSVLDKTGANQAALELKIAQFANELDKRAELEARAQIRNADSQLEFKLSDPAPVYFPESPSHSIQISSESHIEDTPKVPTGGILQGTADRRRLLENQVRIWAALNRYQLAQTPKGVWDATQEFQLWRQQHGSGPSNN